MTLLLRSIRSSENKYRDMNAAQPIFGRAAIPTDNEFCTQNIIDSLPHSSAELMK